MSPTSRPHVSRGRVELSSEVELLFFVCFVCLFFFVLWFLRKVPFS